MVETPIIKYQRRLGTLTSANHERSQKVYEPTGVERCHLENNVARKEMADLWVHLQFRSLYSVDIFNEGPVAYLLCTKRFRSVAAFVFATCGVL